MIYDNISLEHLSAQVSSKHVLHASIKLDDICMPAYVQAQQEFKPTVVVQVRWYKGDNEQRWYMWYSGRTTASDSMDCIHPAAGAIGAAAAACLHASHAF